MIAHEKQCQYMFHSKYVHWQLFLKSYQWNHAMCRLALVWSKNKTREDFLAYVDKVMDSSYSVELHSQNFFTWFQEYKQRNTCDIVENVAGIDTNTYCSCAAQVNMKQCQWKIHAVPKVWRTCSQQELVCEAYWICGEGRPHHFLHWMRLLLWQCMIMITECDHQVPQETWLQVAVPMAWLLKTQSGKFCV